MSVAELERRMHGWLESGWLIDIFLEDGKVIGYAVHQRCTDEYHPAETVIYLRQLFIERGHRNHGLGTLAFQDLVRTRFPRRSTVVIDVLVSNPKGLTFWERLGFRAYSTKMRLD
jgi:GNAT superfamily N-acetyltransferase